MLKKILAKIREASSEIYVPQYFDYSVIFATLMFHR